MALPTMKPSVPTTSTATLSVVLPNYNHGHVIGRALRALLAQERAADEILIIDDGSGDDSVAVIQKFAATARSIRLLLNPDNMGVIPTLQRGLEAARGRYVYFAASDDWVLPGFFALALRRLEADSNMGLFAGEAMLVNAITNQPFAVRPAVRPVMRAARIGPERVRELLAASDNWILTGSAIYRRDSVLAAGGFQTRLGTFADGFISRKIALQSGFFFEPRIVASWAVSTDSASRRTALDSDRSREILDVVPQAIATDSTFPSWYADLFRDRWRFATCRLALMGSPIDRSFVLTMGTRSVAERRELSRLMDIFGDRLARPMALAWLWWRLRPIAVFPLLRTALALRQVRLALRFRLRLLNREVGENGPSAS